MQSRPAETSGKAPIADDFFGEDSDDEADEESKVLSKKNAKQRDKSRSVTFSVPNDDEESSTIQLHALSGINEESKHFAMEAILKAEKAKGKKHKRTRKRNVHDEEVDLLQEDFTIDVQDERFTALHDDYAFALDPTNPQ